MLFSLALTTLLKYGSQPYFVGAPMLPASIHNQNPNTAVGIYFALHSFTLISPVLPKISNIKQLLYLQKAVKCVEEIIADNPVEESDVVDLCLLQDTLSATGYIYTTLRSELLKMEGSYALPLLTVKGSDKSLDEVFSVYSALDNKEVFCFMKLIT